VTRPGDRPGARRDDRRAVDPAGSDRHGAVVGVALWGGDRPARRSPRRV